MQALLFASLALFSFSVRADFAAYTSLNDFQVTNEDGKVVLKDETSKVKKVDLRENLAAVLSTFDNLTVVDSKGTKIVNQAYANDYKITSQYVAVLGGKRLKLFSRQGTAKMDHLWVKAMGLSNTMLAYREDRSASYLIVKDMSGREIFTQFNNVEAKVSDNFLFAKDAYGYVSLINKNGERLNYSNQLTDFQLSDSFATMTDINDFTQILDENGDTVLSGFNIKLLSVLNEVIAYEQNGQLFVINKDKSTRFWASFSPEMSIFNEGLVLHTKSGLTQFVNRRGEIFFTTFKADHFTASKNLLSFQSSEQQVYVFSYDKTKIFEEINPDMGTFMQSHTLFSLTGKTANTLRVYNMGKKIIDAMRVQDVWLTNTDQKLNFRSF